MLCMYGNEHTLIFRGLPSTGVGTSGIHHCSLEFENERSLRGSFVSDDLSPQFEADLRT